MAGWASTLVLVGALLTVEKGVFPGRLVLPTITIGSFTRDLNIPEGKALFDVLTDFAMFGAVTFETLAVASIFMLRWRYPNAERSYRCWGYPITPILYVLILGAVLTNMFRSQPPEAFTGVAFIAVGAAVYLLSPLRKTQPTQHVLPVAE